MIGHALTVAPAPAVWDRWIAAGFAIASTCFFIGPRRSVASHSSRPAASVKNTDPVKKTIPSAPGPTSSKKPGNNTYDAMQSGLDTQQEDRLVFAPDLFGSACFLVSGALAYHASKPGTRTLAAVNLAGCVFFMISALASYVVPSSGSMLDLAAVYWTTALGALGFLIGALLLLSHSKHHKEVPA